MSFFTANVVLMLLVLGFGISLLIAWMAWRSAASRPVARWLIPMMLGPAFWSAGDILIISLPVFEQKRSILLLVYIGIALVMWSLPLFALEYAGMRQYTRRKWILIFAIEPVILLLLVLTNDFHRLFWLRTEALQIADIAQVNNTYGPFFWLHTAYAYVILLGSSALLIRALIRAHQGQRTLNWLVILGVLMPWIGNMLYLARLIPVDLTSLAFTITGFSLSLGIVRYHLFDLTPIARDAVIEVMNDAVLILDNQFRLVDLNKAAWRVFTPPGNPVGLELKNLSPELERLVEANSIEQQLLHSIQIDDNHYEVRFAPLRYANRWAVGWMILLHDVTQTRKAQAAVQAERDFALRVMNNMGQGLTVTDKDNKFIYVNPAYAQITGYDPKAILGKSPLDLTLEEDQPILQSARRKRQQGESSTYENRFLRADGSVVYGLITGVPLTQDGEFNGSIAVITDLTTQKRHQEELLAAQTALQSERDFGLQVMNNMGQGLVVTDRERRFIYANPAYGRITGYSPEQILGKTPFDVTPPEDHADLRTAFAERSRGQGRIYEGRIQRSDGTIVEVLITAVPRFKEGVYDGATAVITDLTAQKQHEAELRQARDQAMQASHMKSVFLATMSHELRTPLTAIMGYSELQLAGMAGSLSPEQHDYTDRILANSNHLLTIINQVLDISKIEAGRMELVSVTFQPRQLLDEVLRQAGSLPGDKPVALQSERTNLPDQLSGDPDRLKQILLNLISNAVKFTEKGEVKIRLHGVDQQHWAIVVADTGIGIPPEALPYIFDEFRQVDSTSTRQHNGTGLGLAIVRKLARLMGGEVAVQSQVGKGSTFTVTLPYQQPQP
jgi:PAS domain S-box-containing protein